MTTLSSISYFSSFNDFIPALFNFSTAFTTLLSPSCAFWILFLKPPSSTSVFTPLIYPGFINIWSSLSLSTLSCQSGLLLSPLALPILFPGTLKRLAMTMSVPVFLLN